MEQNNCDKDTMLAEEKARLGEVLAVARRELARETDALKRDKGSFLSMLREYDEMVSGSSVKVKGGFYEESDAYEAEGKLDADFGRLLELSSFVTYLYDRGSVLRGVARSVVTLKRLVDSPYFGRFDFVFDDGGDRMTFCVGRHGLTDPDGGEIMVYDWRSPVSSVFYRFKTGRAAYPAPAGEITGEVALKRQMKIEKSELRFVVETQSYIEDELLAAELSRNASGKMRDIVETIQREQDVVIRDETSDLLMVQGEAGSGKTSVALHRVAFLLYEQDETRLSSLSSKNILILTPSEAFGRYISAVLPELGEDAVLDTDLARLLEAQTGISLGPEAKSRYLDGFFNSRGEERANREALSRFLGARDLARLIERFASYAERRLISFSDLWYGGRCIATRQDFKRDFLENSARRPAAKRLGRLAERYMTAVRDRKEERVEYFHQLVLANKRHPFDAPAYAESLYLREREAFRKQVEAPAEFDVRELYFRLFRDEALFERLSKGLDLPERARSRAFLAFKSAPDYSDAPGLLYLSLLLKGEAGGGEIKQVVVDEAQDYTPCVYAALGLLYKNARFTVVGDTGQSLDAGKWGGIEAYRQIEALLGKKTSRFLQLDKCYRSTREITRYARRLRGLEEDGVAFAREGGEVDERFFENWERTKQAASEKLAAWKEAGYENVALLTQSRTEAARAAKELGAREIDEEGDPTEGIVALPAYLAKGFEFDAVLFFRGTEEDERARKLAYVAATRALHSLAVFKTAR